MAQSESSFDCVPRELRGALSEQRELFSTVSCVLFRTVTLFPITVKTRVLAILTFDRFGGQARFVIGRT